MKISFQVVEPDFCICWYMRETPTFLGLGVGFPLRDPGQSLNTYVVEKS